MPRRIERIVSVAIYHGMILSMPAPARHFEVLRAMGDDSLKHNPKNQGFLTSEGRFVSREEAHTIAYRSGQCKNPDHPTQLFSEDLW